MKLKHILRQLVAGCFEPACFLQRNSRHFAGRLCSTPVVQSDFLSPGTPIRRRPAMGCGLDTANGKMGNGGRIRIRQDCGNQTDASTQPVD